MTTHELKKKAALDAIDDLRGDPSVALHETLGSLVDVRKRVNELIDDVRHAICNDMDD